MSGIFFCDKRAVLGIFKWVIMEFSTSRHQYCIH